MQHLSGGTSIGTSPRPPTGLEVGQEQGYEAAFTDLGRAAAGGQQRLARYGARRAPRKRTIWRRVATCKTRSSTCIRAPIKGEDLWAQKSTDPPYNGLRAASPCGEVNCSTASSNTLLGVLRGTSLEWKWKSSTSRSWVMPCSFAWRLLLVGGAGTRGRMALFVQKMLPPRPILAAFQCFLLRASSQSHRPWLLGCSGLSRPGLPGVCIERDEMIILNPRSARASCKRSLVTVSLTADYYPSRTPASEHF
jgi:hypothetical protein